MADVDELSEAERHFIDRCLPGRTNLDQVPEVPSSEAGETKGRSLSRPFVTLTYACSLDAMVSLSPGVRTTLSGPETKSMTHYLRRHHDAILIGVGTAVTDDPSLNCRYPGGATQPALQPAILDPILRWNAEESKVAALAREGKGKRPWIITTAERATSSQQPGQVAQYLPIDNEGLQILQANEPSTSRRLRWQSILEGLKRKGVNSVMIEGGATVINDLLSEPYLVDSVIVTIAPTWLGQGGTVVSPAPKFASGVRANAARLQETSWRQFGQDVVLCGRLR